MSNREFVVLVVHDDEAAIHVFVNVQRLELVGDTGALEEAQPELQVNATADGTFLAG